MSDITNNEVALAATDAVASEVVDEVVVTEAAAPVAESVETVETAATTEAVAAEAEAAAPVATTAPAPRKGPVVTTPVVKETKAAAVVEDDGSRENPRKVREGIVISDKMDMTLVVAVNERVSHPRYGKTVQRTKKLYVHDEKNDAKVGDRVRVQETRPLSKLKRWRLTEVVERAR